MPLTFQPMDEAGTRAILKWRYDAPYDIYNIDPDNVEKEMQVFLDPQNAYHTVTDEHSDLVAYCCFGPDGQVPGGDYSAAALDIGLGVRPDLTGQGRGLYQTRMEDRQYWLPDIGKPIAPNPAWTETLEKGWASQ